MTPAGRIARLTRDTGHSSLHACQHEWPVRLQLGRILEFIYIIFHINYIIITFH